VEVSIMKSGKAEIYRPPGGRTERDVAAEVIARLLKGGVLSRSPAVVARAAAAVGVPVALVREKWARDGLATVPFDGTLVQDQERSTPVRPVSEPPPDRPEWKNRNAARLRQYNRKKWERKNPEPGKRVCSRCKELKPVSDFAVKDKGKGTLRSMCNPCVKDYQHDRYLSSAKLEKLGPVLRFILEDGDEHAGMICPDCRQPCRVGDEVIATDAVLHHASHHEVGKP
jgi:hypothetical protein